MSDYPAEVAAPGYVDRLAAGWLVQLRRDPDRGLLGMQLTLAANPPGGDDVWARLAMDLSEYPGPVEPERPGAAEFCDFCGNSDPAGLVPGPDGPARPERLCRDDLLDACLARRERRWPADLARVPMFIFDAAQGAREREDHGHMIRLAAGQAAEAWLAEMSQVGDVLALSAGPDSPPPAPWQQTFRPADPWAHVLGRNRGHTVGAQQEARLGPVEGGDRPQEQQVNQSARPAPGRRRRGRGRRR